MKKRTSECPKCGCDEVRRPCDYCGAGCRDVEDDAARGVNEHAARAAEAALMRAPPIASDGPCRFPTALVSLARVDRLRDVRCSRYDDCVRQAASRRWPGWVCVGCSKYRPMPTDERETDGCPVEL